MGCFENVDSFNKCTDAALRKVFRVDDESLRADHAKRAAKAKEAELTARISTGNVSNKAPEQPLVERWFGNGLATQFKKDKEAQVGL